jgi:PleD family two-component response regulator
MIPSLPSPTLSTSTDLDRVVVFLVDDHDIEAELVRSALRADPDIEIHHCSQGDQAVEQACLIQPTVILQDLGMAERNGLSIISQFRATPATQDVPIIVYSGWDDPKIKSVVFSIGANDFLVKPAEPLEFAARLRYHSRAFHNHRRRLEMERALRASEERLKQSNDTLLATNRKLTEALTQVKELRGLLPMCTYCRRVRNDQNYWGQLEAYIVEHSDVELSHGVCEECFDLQAKDLGLTPADIVVLRNKLGLRPTLTTTPPPP